MRTCVRVWRKILYVMFAPPPVRNVQGHLESIVLEMSLLIKGCFVTFRPMLVDFVRGNLNRALLIGF